jgi:hypothetical protein
VNRSPRLSNAKQIAADIVDMVAVGTPAEFQMALTLATAIYFKANFANSLEEALRLHTENLRAALEELDKTPVLDLSSADVTELLG